VLGVRGGLVFAGMALCLGAGLHRRLRAGEVAGRRDGPKPGRAAGSPCRCAQREAAGGSGGGAGPYRSRSPAATMMPRDESPSAERQAELDCAARPWHAPGTDGFGRTRLARRRRQDQPGAGLPVAAAGARGAAERARTCSRRVRRPLRDAARRPRRHRWPRAHCPRFDSDLVVRPCATEMAAPPVTAAVLVVERRSLGRRRDPRRTALTRVPGCRASQRAADDHPTMSLAGPTRCAGARARLGKRGSRCGLTSRTRTRSARSAAPHEHGSEPVRAPPAAIRSSPRGAAPAGFVVPPTRSSTRFWPGCAR